MPDASDASRPPRVLLVIGHGRRQSFCHHLLEIVQKNLSARGMEYQTQDLLADGFDPVLRLEEGQQNAGEVDRKDDPLTATYQEAVRWADAYVVIHPVWWFAPPAILKGWVDRVLVDGVALHQPADGSPPQGILTGRRALVIQTFNADRVIDKVVFGSLSKHFWRRMVFPAVGIKKASYLPCYSLARLDAARLQRIERRLQRTLEAFLAPLAR